MSAIVNKRSNKAYSGHRDLRDTGYRDLRAIWGPVWGTVLEVDSGSILGHIWVDSEVISEEPHGIV